jgi:hypothetical protein
MKKGDVKNSPGILKGYDPYMWESHDEAYKVLPQDIGVYHQVLKALENRTIFLIGDSLTRQWVSAVLEWEGLNR